MRKPCPGRRSSLIAAIHPARFTFPTSCAPVAYSLPPADARDLGKNARRKAGATSGLAPFAAPGLRAHAAHVISFGLIRASSTVGEDSLKEFGTSRPHGCQRHERPIRSAI